MQTRVELCPSGVAVVVPEPLASQAGLRVGTPATLADLLAGITPDNLHGEWAAGPPAGAELL